MCSEIRHAAAAVFRNIAPCRIMAVNPARGEGGMILRQWSRALPEIPVEPRLHGFLRQIMGPRRPAEIHVHMSDLAENAIERQFTSHPELTHGALHGTRLQHASRGFDRIHDHDGFVDVMG